MVLALMAVVAGVALIATSRAVDSLLDSHAVVAPAPEST